MRVLLTNYRIITFAGSEINTLQLCLALRNLGVHADVATFFYDYPMKELYENNRIQVFQLFNPDLDLDKYDLLWTHHNPTLDQIIFGDFYSSNPKKIIFSSLGAFEPLEAPPYYHNELNIILSNSGGNTYELVKQGVKKEKISYFPNFAPREFFEKCSISSPEKLKKIAFISNHLPDEIEELTRLSKSEGIDVEHIGVGGTETFVDENLIKEFDLIISIGKTVQYCFALKIPIYCFDHFGGPGYLNKGNIKSAEFFNFSGRGINRKLTGKELLHDIIVNYDECCEHLEFLFSYAFEKFNLEKNISNVFKLVSFSDGVDLSLIRSNYPLVHRRHKGFLRDQERIKTLYSRFSDIQNGHQLQQAFERLSDENLKLQQEVLFYSLSKSWRITRPLRKIMKVLKKGKVD